jgi:hypothetical protein
MKKLLFISMFLIGCYKDPISSKNTDNPEIDVQYMFKHDECHFSRFYDKGIMFYFVKCDNGEIHLTK